MRLNDDYVSVEQYRQLKGFTSRQPLYRAIREGRLEHKRFEGRIMIPRYAILVDKRIKTGRYIGLKQWVERQISNADELPDITERMKGISTRRGKDYVDNEWEQEYNDGYQSKGVR